MKLRSRGRARQLAALNVYMALAAENDEIGKKVGALKIAAEFSERDDVMNVSLYTVQPVTALAYLASVVVALACLARLARPIWAAFIGDTADVVDIARAALGDALGGVLAYPTTIAAAAQGYLIFASEVGLAAVFAVPSYLHVLRALFGGAWLAGGKLGAALVRAETPLSAGVGSKWAFAPFAGALFAWHVLTLKAQAPTLSAIVEVARQGQGLHVGETKNAPYRVATSTR